MDGKLGGEQEGGDLSVKGDIVLHKQNSKAVACKIEKTAERKLGVVRKVSQLGAAGNASVFSSTNKVHSMKQRIMWNSESVWHRIATETKERNAITGKQAP